MASGLPQPDRGPAKVCGRCGAFGDMPHAEVEGDCILPHRLTKEHHPPQASIGHACTHCVDRHREWLTEITELFAALPDVVELGSVEDEMGQDASGKHRKRPASPAPVRLEAWAMLNDRARLLMHGGHRGDGKTPFPFSIYTTAPDVPFVLAAWTDWLYENLGFTDPPATVAACCNALSAYAERIAATPWLDDYDAELRWLRIALRRVHGISNPRPLGACLNRADGTACTGSVWRDEEDPTKDPRCDKCGRRYDETNLRRLLVEKKRAELAAKGEPHEESLASAHLPPFASLASTAQPCRMAKPNQHMRSGLVTLDMFRLP